MEMPMPGSTIADDVNRSRMIRTRGEITMPKKAHFSPALFQFLKELQENNRRPWFEKNKPRYERDVKRPLLQLIGDFATPLQKISPHFVADPRSVGGSLFRIYRDTRFSKDKSPYKTHAAAQFRHEKGKDVHAPGFYLHLAPGEVFVGAGIWHPDSAALQKIRAAIVDDPAGWKRIIKTKKFRDACSREGDSLQRPPRGYDPEHPLIEDLKRKDHIAVTRFTQRDACAPDFLQKFTLSCKAMSPYVRFLTEALGLAY